MHRTAFSPLPDQPFISVCIPTYRRAELLPRLLDSLCVQTFRDFEVVVTDNTEAGNDEVERMALSYRDRLPLTYYRNPPGLTMGENWNRCFSLAKGEWLKMIHDDDWLCKPDSLEQFARAARESGALFLFSSYYLTDPDKGAQKLMFPPADALRRLRKEVLYLAKSNIIGPPSVTMIHRSAVLPYKALKWMVDVEGYIRMLQQGKGSFHWIEEPLMCILEHSGQATHAYFRNPEVEIPENLEILTSHEPEILDYYWSYDHFWRLLRNTGIRDEAALRRLAQGQAIPRQWLRMLRVQKRLPHRLLQSGVFSKIAMTISYLTR